MFSTIKPTSPDPSTYLGFPEDQDDWGCEIWRTYYDRNKAALGKTKSLEILRVDIDRIGFFADVHLCKYDCEFVDYFSKEYGESVGTIFTDIYCTGKELTSAVSTAASGAHSGIKMLSLIIPIIVVGGVIVGGEYVYKNYIK